MKGKNSAHTTDSTRNWFTPRFILVHYDEIALKGKNRKFFEDALADSIRFALRESGSHHVKRLYGRLLVEFSQEVPTREIQARLRDLFGISHFELAERVGLDLEEIQERIWDFVGGLSPPPKSFAVVTRRANKDFPQNSMEVNHKVGRFVVDRTGWKVSINDPDLPIYIFIVEKHAYIAFERTSGAGGLPVGVAGKVACLLSGGIDSPVAASRMMRRGCRPIFVHFHSAPHTSAESQEKVREIAGQLMQCYRPSRLYLIPFAELQRRIVAAARPPYRIILYRRFMVRAAEAIALREGARALVTGECLSQVSSQTLQNLATIDRVATLPVLRPLIGFDKVEIVREAERIGTFAVSIQPHDDCCSFLMPRHPATYSTPAELEGAEKAFDVPKEIEALVRSAEAVDVGGEGY